MENMPAGFEDTVEDSRDGTEGTAAAGEGETISANVNGRTNTDDVEEVENGLIVLEGEDLRICGKRKFQTGAESVARKRAHQDSSENEATLVGNLEVEGLTYILQAIEMSPRSGNKIDIDGIHPEQDSLGYFDAVGIISSQLVDFLNNLRMYYSEKGKAYVGQTKEEKVKLLQEFQELTKQSESKKLKIQQLEMDLNKERKIEELRKENILLADEVKTLEMDNEWIRKMKGQLKDQLEMSGKKETCLMAKISLEKQQLENHGNELSEVEKVMRQLRQDIEKLKHEKERAGKAAIYIGNKYRSLYKAGSVKLRKLLKDYPQPLEEGSMYKAPKGFPDFSTIYSITNS